MLHDAPDFSLVLGGPIYQFLRRSHLSGDALEHVTRRMILLGLLAWLPLLIGTAIEGLLLPGRIKVPFLHDFEAHSRLLIALPVLVYAELLVHRRLRLIVKAFLTRGIVVAEDEPRFVSAIEAAQRIRNSIPLELGLLIAVFTVGQWMWRSQLNSNAQEWYGVTEGGRLQLTISGYWYAFVSIPLFQFVLLRWYLRFFVWFSFLWRVSRLNLNLIATHPDHAGGIGFLGRSTYAFSPILFAQGVLLSGLIATRVLYRGAELASFRLEAISLIAFFLAFILGPLLMFSPQLARAKRQGLAEYGTLASRYVEDFKDRWITHGDAHASELLGAADIQSLADLGNSYEVVKDMRPVPFSWQDVVRLVLATAIPLLPLGLTVLSLEDLVVRVLKILV
jgi:hypothetical protein